MKKFNVCVPVIEMSFDELDAIDRRLSTRPERPQTGPTRLTVSFTSERPYFSITAR